MQDIFSAGNAAAGCICTEEKPSNRKTTIFSAEVFKDGETDCTAHYIRENVLDQIILHNLKTVTAYAERTAGRILFNGSSER